METAKAADDKRLKGLGLIIILFTVAILSPIGYFIVNYLMGNESPVYK